VLLCTALLPASAYGGQGQAALERAAVLVQEGKLQEADQQAQLALSDPATRAVACSVLGAIRVQQDRLDEGAKLLEEAVRLDPRLLGAQLNLAQLYVLRGTAERALPLFRKVLELDPQNASARLALARAEAEKGNYKKSLELAKPALAAFKESPDGLLVLATDFLKTGDRSSARALLEDAKRLDDVPTGWPVSFAEVLVKGGLAAEGIGLLEQTRKADPSSYELAFALAGAYPSMASRGARWKPTTRPSC